MTENNYEMQAGADRCLRCGYGFVLLRGSECLLTVHYNNFEWK